MNISGKRVCFLGDSITEGHIASDLSKTSYVALFKKKYPNADIKNFGINGTKIAKRLGEPSEYAFWDDDFVSRVDKIDAAELVVVFGGTNDYGMGDAPLGKFGDKTSSTFYGAIFCLYEKLLYKFPYAKFLIITPLHRTGENHPNAQGDVLKDFVTAIRETAELFSLPVLDLYSVSGINPNIDIVREKMMPDGLHPNDCGHKRLFEIIDSYIVNLL